MNALYYTTAGQFEVRKVDIPQVNDDQVLIKVALCGMCGTDMHIHEGEFIATFPLIPGHEFIGTIEKLGKDVNGFTVGDRVVADNGISVSSKDADRRALPRQISAIIYSVDTAFTAVAVKARSVKTFKDSERTLRVHLPSILQCTVLRSLTGELISKVHNLSDEAATLIEPSSGPTGLMLAQLLKLNGAVRLVLAAPAGPKLDLAKKLEAADEYIALDRANSAAQLEELKKQNPYGFDAVV
ncbi:hypothetical protein FRC00_006899, partial [Tulasnella sp. 408]